MTPSRLGSALRPSGPASMAPCRGAPMAEQSAAEEIAGAAAVHYRLVLADAVVKTSADADMVTSLGGDGRALMAGFVELLEDVAARLRAKLPPADGEAIEDST